ncbi:MAG TPA: bifunctional 5,10-methylenetetrahydrofolate dehydrogenase/5,10-methenyltetrahydrofolate cyclohydrolase [Vicinamibacterales bacterium]
MSRLLDGNAVARAIRNELAPRIARVREKAGRPPGLGIVLVGNDPASEVYVRHKVKDGTDAGMFVDLVRLPETATLDDTLAEVRRLNASPVHDGIIVQSPLPANQGKAAEMTVFETIDPAKDVDGFSPVNVGRLVQNRAVLRSCTPAGIMELLKRHGIQVAGRHAVVIGRSDIVGKPMALMLLHEHATVTICHSKTPDLAAVASRADILVVAIGRAGLVTPAFVKPGATVIDVGMNRVQDRALVEKWFPPGSPRYEEFERKGSLLVGDVDPAVAIVAGAITPVPGGVGPLTRAMLMTNTVIAAEQRFGL